MLTDLRRAGIEVSREQERFALAGGWLRGKVDAVGAGFLEAPKAEHVVEIKSMKAADWRAVQKHGVAKAKPEHWHQLHAGMAALGIARGAYVAVNKDTEEILVERVRLDVEEANRQEARVERLVAEHEAPLKIAENAERPPCRFCRHKALCFEAAMPRRHCRTCLHFAFGRDGNGHCCSVRRAAQPAAPAGGQGLPGAPVPAGAGAGRAGRRRPRGRDGHLPHARRHRLGRRRHRGSSMTEAELGRWANGAERGESFVYAVASAGVVLSPEESAGAREGHEGGAEAPREGAGGAGAAPRVALPDSLHRAAHLEEGRRAMTRTRLPDRRRNAIRDIAFGGQAFTVCVGYDDAGRPLEVFADGQKTGSTMAAFIDDACIVISIALQHGIAPAALARSLSTVPVWENGVKGEGPASPVGAILAALEPAPAMPWAAA